MSNTETEKPASTPTSPSADPEAPPLTGSQLMDGMIEDVNSLDRFLDRDPHSRPLSRAELLEVIRIARAKRTSFEIKQEKRQVKKQGGIDG